MRTKKIVTVIVVITLIFTFLSSSTLAGSDLSDFRDGGKYYVSSGKSVTLSWGNLYNFPKGTKFTVNTEYLCGCNFLGYYTTSKSCQIPFTTANHINIRHKMAMGNSSVNVLIRYEDKEGRLHDLIRFQVVAIQDTKLYKIVFNTQGGTNVNPVYAYKYESISTSGNYPSRKGYYFNGWFTKPTGGQWVGLMYYVTGDATLYAHWTKK